MKTGNHSSFWVRFTSWLAFGLTWLVLLGYIALLVWNVRGAAPDTTNPPSPLSAVLHAIALPGLPPAPPADALLFVLMCGVFVLALRASPSLLRPKPLASAVTPAAPSTVSTAPSSVAPAPASVSAPVPGSDRRRVFISHSNGDNAFGEALLERLRAAGFDAWYDSRGGPGAEGTWEGGIAPSHLLAR